MTPGVQEKVCRQFFTPPTQLGPPLKAAGDTGGWFSEIPASADIPEHLSNYN